MFDIGFWEILLISVLALVVLGPERLPKAAKTVGYWVGKARRYIEGVKHEVEQEFDTSELKRILHNQEVQIKELQSKLQDEVDETTSELRPNVLENDDDPGDGHKPGPDYEIIEEDDFDKYENQTPETITEASKEKAPEKSE